LLALVIAALALPATAAAHGRSPTVALDYRIELHPPAGTGMSVHVLDGDRSLRVRSLHGEPILIRGTLKEPMLRISGTGVWVNAGSPTAEADRLAPSGKSGWIKVSSGSEYAWHDHRLSPPPLTTPGPVGEFSVPVMIDGRQTAITGEFVRVARPAFWPWALAAAVLATAIAVATRRRATRAALTIGLGLAAGVFALTEVTTFAFRDAPSGGVAWLQVITALLVAAILGVLLVRLHGRSRIHAAGVVGAVAAAVSLSSLPVFWHGVIISVLPATAARAVCGLAIALGVAAAVLSFLPEFDEPVRVRTVRR
jgi:hypothetical protein